MCSRTSDSAVRISVNPQFTAAVAFNIGPPGGKRLVDAAEGRFGTSDCLDNELRELDGKARSGIRNAVGVTIEDNRFYSAMTHDATDADNAGQNHAGFESTCRRTSKLSATSRLIWAATKGLRRRCWKWNKGQLRLSNSTTDRSAWIELDEVAELERSHGFCGGRRIGQPVECKLVGADPGVAGTQGSGVGFDGINDYAFSYDASDVEQKHNRTIAFSARIDDVSQSGRKQVLFEDGSFVRGTNVYVADGRVYFADVGSRWWIPETG